MDKVCIKINYLNKPWNGQGLKINNLINLEMDKVCIKINYLN